MNVTPRIPCSPGAFTDPRWTTLSAREQRPRLLDGMRLWVWCCHVIPCGHLTVDFPRRSWSGKASSGLPAGRTTTRPFIWHKAFITQAQNTLAVQRTEPQCQALKEWTYPDWFTPAPHKGKARAAPKKSECPLATSSGHSVDGPTDLAATSAAKPQLPLFPELPPPHDDSWQPHHLEDVRLNMLKLQDTPEMWAMWIDQHPDKCPRGIVAMVTTTFIIKTKALPG
jgi:hypothetical protein